MGKPRLMRTHPSYKNKNVARVGHTFSCAGLREAERGSCYPAQAKLGRGTHFRGELRLRNATADLSTALIALDLTETAVRIGRLVEGGARGPTFR